MGRTTIVCFSGEFDKLFASLIIANGSLAQGDEASIFFTFHGLNRIKKGGLGKGKLSAMHYFGMGKWMIKRLMKKKKVASLETLLADFKELGGRIIACDMTMDIMGVPEKKLDMSIVDEIAGVGSYLKDAYESEVTLFI